MPKKSHTPATLEQIVDILLEVQADISSLKSDNSSLKADNLSLKSGLSALQSEFSQFRFEFEDFRIETRKNFADAQSDRNRIEHKVDSLVQHTKEDIDMLVQTTLIGEKRSA